MKVLSALIIFGAFVHKTHSQSQFNNFGGSYSTIQANNGGNNVIISRRTGPNQEQEDYISVSNPNIRIDGDYFSCSTLVCPQNTFKCIVTSETVLENEAKMKTVAECLDKNERVLDKKEYFEDNPFPNIQPPFSRHSSVDRDGSISVEDSNGKNVFNSKKMTKEQEEEMMNEIKRGAEQHQQQMQQFQAQMNKFHEDMQKTFGNGFPFGNQGFPFTQNIPFYPAPTLQFPSNFPYHTYYAPPQYSSHSEPARYSSYSAPNQYFHNGNGQGQVFSQQYD